MWKSSSFLVYVSGSFAKNEWEAPRALLRENEKSLDLEFAPGFMIVEKNYRKGRLSP